MKTISQNESNYPLATHRGEVVIGNVRLSCFVLDNGNRILGVESVVLALTRGIKGVLSEYIKRRVVRQFLPEDLQTDRKQKIPAVVQFVVEESGRLELHEGLASEKFREICVAYDTARRKSLSGELRSGFTPRHFEIACGASHLIREMDKINLANMIDEATGYEPA